MSEPGQDLDDRLRRAHQRQLTQTRRQLEDVRFRSQPTTPALGHRILAAAAVLVVLGAGTLAVLRFRSDDTSNIAATGDPSPISGSVNTRVPTLQDSQSSTTYSSPKSTAPTSDPAALPVSDGASVDTEPVGSEPVDTEPTSTPTATAGSPTTTGPIPSGSDTPAPTVPAIAHGVTNTVCPSGRRAELERATLSYVGSNEGWGRLDDLVDEQDGPHYFETWEPGYPNSVSVLVQLEQPVLATEIRIAQDPFAPVAGIIVVDALDQQFALQLEGMGGWVTAEFTPQVLGSFTITRSERLSNVMEVLVCVDPGTG